MTRVPGRSYVVGGAVRDRLLGLPVSDRDHVVVGATVDAMKAAGFRAVGRDFPVFLHPESHEEYALARTERKVAAGYAGFVFHADPSVTLAQDLERRDLTINAIAVDETSGELTDPFGGQADLQARIFRHVGPAFSEDPVRVLRLARFAARFTDFAIAPETLSLARAMAAAGEIDALVPERVWQELSRGLLERDPVRMLDLLRDADAFARLLPECAALDEARWSASVAALRRATVDGATLDVRLASLLHAVDADAIARLCARLAVPRATRELAILVAREGPELRRLFDVRSPGLEPAAPAAALLDRADAYRRRPRFLEMVDAVAATIDDGDARSAFRGLLERTLAAADRVDIAAIVRGTPQPTLIAGRIRDARTAAIGDLWKNNVPARPDER